MVVGVLPLPGDCPRPVRGEWFDPKSFAAGVEERRRGEEIPPLKIQYAARIGWLEQDYIARYGDEPNRVGALA